MPRSIRASAVSTASPPPSPCSTASQRLAHFNQAYVDLWQLDAKWLSERPRDGEILDRLRQSRSLPEKADYRDWKRSWLAAYGSNTQKEDQWHLPDGRTLHVIADSLAEGGVTYLYENVTERLALESRYNALIHVQSETLDMLREGVAVFASNGRLRLSNRAFAAIWRLSPALLSSAPHIDDVIFACRPLYDEPQEWERIKSAVTSIFAERRPYESQFDRPDGTVIACAALPLPDGGTLLTYNDVTDSKRVERALRERNEALETADRVKSAFVSHVSYELRTPLTNIIGFSELLANPSAGALGDKQREYLNDIRASGQTLLAIIDDILDLATIDAGTFELKLTRVKVKGVIDAAVMGLRERLKQNSLDLKVDVEPGLDEFVADGPRVTQILYNLLANAIGFSPTGGKVLLTCRRDQDRIAFTVEDEGCGIPEEHHSVVFERFETRANGSGHRGAGLGLAIVKSLVELHGGTVMLASTPGSGTRVRATLPLDHAGATADGRAAPLRIKPLRMSETWSLDDVDLVGLDRLAQRLALILKPGDVIGLSGPLGAGKTTFARLLLARLGAEGEVPSPTFALVQSYATPRFPVNHCDFYRLEASELGELGLEDVLATAVTIVEWPERASDFMPKDRLDIAMDETPSPIAAASC